MRSDRSRFGMSQATLGFGMRHHGACRSQFALFDLQTPRRAQPVAVVSSDSVLAD
jgi:hypothetical protein